MLSTTKPYVLGESAVPHKAGLLLGKGGELAYVYYLGVYPDGRIIPENLNGKIISRHYVVVPGIVMRRAGLDERVLMCSPVPPNQREEVKVLISGELRLLPRDIRFAFW
ncbi:MAG: hypothetical protein AABX75_01270 [Nanoarchaeota archaeon]